MLLFTTIVVTLAMIDDSEPSSIAIYVGMGGMAAALVIYILWTSAAPARELARRAPIGRARTRAELKQRMTGQMTYSYIVATAVGGLMLPAILGDGEGYLEGLNAVWTALGIVILGIAAFAAIRKWRFDHKHDG